MIFCHERFKGDIDIYNGLPLVFKYIASNRRYGHTYYGLVNETIPLYYLSEDEFYIQWENMFLGRFEKDYRNYYVYVPTLFDEIPELFQPEPEPIPISSDTLISPMSNTTNFPLNILKCPITHEIMREPVMMVDGYSYEKRAIQHWLTQSNRSPMTNLPLHDTRLIPNLKLLEIINEIL